MYIIFLYIVLLLPLCTLSIVRIYKRHCISTVIQERNENSQNVGVEIKLQGPNRDGENCTNPRDNFHN